MRRTKLIDRKLPRYTKGEEIMNMVTHIAGGALAILAWILCASKALSTGSTAGLVGSLIYGFTMVALYTVSSIYHGLKPGTGKKVMQVIDHCTIYFLIAGTYTPILLSAFLPVYPIIGWGLLTAQWVLCFLAATLTAIDLKAYNTFSMFCYIGMGWSIIFFIPQCIRVLSPTGFYFLLSGGIAYTIGAILYGIGSKKPWIHSVFHIFVVLGSALQFISIIGFVL